MTTVWLLSMYFTWVTPASRQVDNIPPKIECISMAEEFIEAAQLTKGYLVNYTCMEHRPAPEGEPFLGAYRCASGSEHDHPF